MFTLVRRAYPRQSTLDPKSCPPWDPPKTTVTIYNDKTLSTVAVVPFDEPVQGVRASKTHLIVIQLNDATIYNMDIPIRDGLSYETASNPFGLCCLGKTMVLFPGLNAGHVRAFNLETGESGIIPAHSHALRAIALSPDEKLVATASEQGTLIRVFTLPEMAKVYEFRRGVGPADILCLAFSPDSRYLAATSNHSTLHIFDLVEPPDPKQQKWAVLAKVPGLHRPFSDTYASATIDFKMGDEPGPAGAPSQPKLPPGVAQAIPGGSWRPNKGKIGWVSNHTLVIIGAGHAAVWEKFVVTEGSHGSRIIEEIGWRSFLE